VLRIQQRTVGKEKFVFCLVLFKKSFSAFTFSVDKKNDGFGVMPQLWVAVEKISGNDKRSVPSELTNQVINRSFAV
jgi:hypothetical protein